MEIFSNKKSEFENRLLQESFGCLISDFLGRVDDLTIVY
jgi:hypothetical protein